MFCFCIKNNTPSKVKDFISLNQIKGMQSLDSKSTISLPKRQSLFTQELKKLGASPAQIQVALVILNGDKCVTLDENCILLIHRTILTRAHYEKFSKLLILSTEPTQELINGDLININIKRNHLPIPAELKTAYNKIFSSQDLSQLAQNHADLYLKIIDRGLQADGTINPQVAIPEMATVFEKLEKQFLLLERAVKINPTGLQTFFKTFGFTDQTHIKIISQAFTDNINSLRKFYNPILSKIKTTGWNGLEYMDLMKFYSGFYASLDFKDIDIISQKIDTSSPSAKKSFFSGLSIYSPDLSGTDKFGFLMTAVETASKNGQILVLSHQYLKEYTPFLTNMAVPIFSTELPNVFMSQFDNNIQYSNELINHDALGHAYRIQGNSILNSVSLYFADIRKSDVKPSLKEMKSVIKRKLNSNLKEINNVNKILSQLTSKDQNVFYAFLMHSFHETQVYTVANNFTHNEFSLGEGFKKFLNPSSISDFFPKISRYGITQSDVEHFTTTLKSLQNQTPNIFDNTSDVILKAFIKYFKK